MAFNFNWSPLAADASLYTRAQDMLTAALNKTPKPPIIVDDILVHEMNLGSTPPDLEILEVGDLAEDRFRGIFKMTYTGDAFLTLKTRVQANPLNTYLSTRPSFASPEPLAAASGLTIPLKITLSDIKLSAFIILVFSKQKGLTLVFRNDPLESLKVSSTFDSISFVRDYLQKEIEGQLRALLMDELPAIIHRLSLRLWSPDYREKDDQEIAHSAEDGEPEEVATNPLDSPPQDPVDINGNVLDPAQIASLSLDSSAETQALFSRKNMERLGDLADSTQTLSLFNPGLSDVIYRAWAGPLERGEKVLSAPISRKPSHVASYSNSDSLSESASLSTRPSMTSFGTSFNSSHLVRHMKPGKKRKHRVINMRKIKTHVDDGESVSGESSNMSAAVSSAASDNGAPLTAPIPEDREIELLTPPTSPPRSRRQHTSPDLAGLMHSPQKMEEVTPRPPARDKKKQKASAAEASASVGFKPLFETGPEIDEPQPISASTETIRPKPRRYFGGWQPPTDEKAGPSNAGAMATASARMSGTRSPQLAAPFPYLDSSPGGILEQAWMMKMAGEIARRMEAQKQAAGSSASFWDGETGAVRGRTPPPAYGM